MFLERDFYEIETLAIFGVLQDVQGAFDIWELCTYNGALFY